MEKLLIALTATVLGVMLMFLGAFILLDLWSWFIVPVFAVKELTIASAMGLSLVGSFFKVHTSISGANIIAKLDLIESETSDKYRSVSNLIAATIVYLMTWGIGAIIQMFI